VMVVEQPSVQASFQQRCLNGFQFHDGNSLFKHKLPVRAANGTEQLANSNWQLAHPTERNSADNGLKGWL